MKKAITVCLVAFTLPLGQAAFGQATRTWVSGVGDDVNPCSRTAPCKTFAGAISKTATGGEINCLDPGGFGAVTITKSITIDCSDVFGSILNAGGINGINVNDSLSATPNTADVVIRSIKINGAGTTPGLNGIRFTAGRSLVVESVRIQNMSGNGISFQPGAAARMTLNDVTITDASGGGGILVQPTGASGSARVTLNNVLVTGMATHGVRLDTTGNTAAAGIRVTMDGSVLTENPGSGVIVNAPAATTSAIMLVTNSNVSNNAGNGLTSQGSANALMLVGRTNIQGNASGLIRTGGGQILSYGDNRLNVNIIADGTFSGPATEN